MSMAIEVNKSVKKPIYQQIVDSILSTIESGSLQLGELLPSINQVAKENGIARETVIKAFTALQERGIITAVHGKGYFLSSKNVDKRNHIFLLLDTFSAYKQTFYKGFRDRLSSGSEVDLYFHHFNPKIFTKLLEEAIGNYTHYIVLPFDAPVIVSSLQKVPEGRLFLTDRYPSFLKDGMAAVYQNFEADVINALSSIIHRIQKYKLLTLVFCDSVTEVPLELKAGFELFCLQNGINYQISCGISSEQKLEEGDSFLLIDDEDLVKLVELTNESNLLVGRDIGIISYNDTPLKKVVGKGISVISTDFRKMGETTAILIESNSTGSIQNPCSFINRESF